jgi:hypothetical protein
VVVKKMARKPRPLALDTLCRKCGKAIDYRYKGAAEGVCGRCSDRERTRRRRRTPRVRPYHRGVVVSRQAPRRRRMLPTALFLAVVIVGGAVAGTYLLSLLLG